MKGNRFTDTVKEYARKLNDDDLRFLQMRLSQRIGADLAEALETLQRNAEVDHWLSMAKSANELYDMVDAVDAALQNEIKRRFAIYEKRQSQ